MPPSHGGDQGFESPTGYQRPLTFAEWFFAFWMILSIARKTVTQLERAVRIPYGLSETTHICWVVFCFYVVFPAGHETESPAEAGVRIPYGLSKTTHICWVVFSSECSCRDPKSPVKIPNMLSKTNQNIRIVIGNLATKCSSRRIYIFMNSNNLRQSY